MVLVFKFQFGEEIRRVTSERELLFTEVIDLAKNLFKGHLPACISLKYKDDEGDIITVGTQRELEEAYRVNKDRVLRFIISEGKIPVPQESTPTSIPSDIIQLLESTLKQVSQTPNGIQMFLSSLLTPPPSTAEHPPATTNTSDNTNNINNTQPQNLPTHEPEIKITVDVTTDDKPLHPARCDSCQKQIRGIRYKCKDCPDFDLCEVCEPNKAGIHSSQHTFMKIPKPAWKKPEPEPPKTQPTPPPQYPGKTPDNAPVVEEKPAPSIPEPVKPILVAPQPAPIVEKPQDKTPVVEDKPSSNTPTPNTSTEKPAEPVKVDEKPSAPASPKTDAKPTKPEPKPADKPKQPANNNKPDVFADQQRKLEDMGFTDKSRNLALLIQENGNLLEVVKHLLDG